MLEFDDNEYIGKMPSGGGGSSGKYQLFERIKDDTNTEIGTVSGFFKDENDTEYAVICLDSTYRASPKKYLSNGSVSVTDLPIYSGNGDFISLINNVYTNTATYNTQKILDFCTAQGYTSTACEHCRSKSFTIDGVTYYGQLPNLCELFQIAKNHIRLSTLDPTESGATHPLLTFPSSNILGSDQGQATGNSSVLYISGVVNLNYTKTVSAAVYPILELPNAI